MVPIQEESSSHAEEAATMINDWSEGVEIRNYKIVRRPDSRNFFDLLASMFFLLMIAGALTAYVWTRCQIVALGYEVQKCQETEQALTRIEKDLILEEEFLKNPERVDNIARNELSMEPLGPYQRIAPGFSEFEVRPATLALVNTQPTSVQPRRPSANNN
jgi:cell division protein FtsL